MKIKLFYKLVDQRCLTRTSIYNKNQHCNSTNSCSIKRTFSATNTNSAQLQMLFFMNNANKILNLRNISRWTPNIIKSSEMNYPIPEGTIVEGIWSRVDQWAEKVALVCSVTGREMKYNELRETSKKVATSLLTELGLSPGNVLAVVLPNIFEYPPLLLGALEAGIVVSPFNPSNSDDLREFLRESGAAAVVTFPEKLPLIHEVTSKLNMTDLKIIVTPNSDGSFAQQLPNNTIHFSSLISNRVDIQMLDSIKPKSVTPDDTTIIPYSSGTTGKPKAVCLTHRNLVAIVKHISYIGYFREATSGIQDVAPLFIPISHVYGLLVILAAGLFSGTKVILMPKFEESLFLKAFGEYKGTVLFAEPSTMLQICNSSSISKGHFTSLKRLIYGGSFLPESDLLRCKKMFPDNAVILQGYGLTEAPSVCSVIDGSKPDLNRKTVGKPLFNTQIKVIDLQTGQALGANEEGEIWIKGPQVMKGYFNNPKATKECFDEEGWLHTGDVGCYDDEKQFFISGRIIELIKVKGFQVSPYELEAVLRTHPDVLDAGVVGVPHSEHGETPIAFIQSKITDESILEKNIRNYVKEKLATYKQISKYFLIDNIPKNSVGKILRNDLKNMYATLTK